MSRPVTIFTGQWANLTFEEVCKMMSEIGYDGLEIACWGDHLDPKRARRPPTWIACRPWALRLEVLGYWLHVIRQCVGDNWDPRLDTFAPDHVKGQPDKIREWAIEEMKNVARAAKNMGVKVVTGFTGSPIWAYWYSFPPTPEEMVEEGFNKIVELWTPIFDEFDKQGVRFALEVHHTEIAFDLYTTEKLLRHFNRRPTLGINFDPSHLVWQGVEPHLFIREFGDRIYHVHMKDAAVTLDGKAGILGSFLTFGDPRALELPFLGPWRCEL